MRAGRFAGLFGLRVSDQEERAERGDFPEQAEPKQIVGEDQAEHRTHEDEKNGEENGRRSDDFGVGMLVIIAHVTPARRGRCRCPPGR
jgi:hypothetical protein